MEGKVNKIEKETFQFGPWIVTAAKGHILKSIGTERDKFENELKLPQVPEMIFADNLLQIYHEGGFGIEFNPLDALKLVDAEHDLIKVSYANEWKQARLTDPDCSEFVKEVVKPFDWTFSTAYKGSLLHKDGLNIEVSKTDERIDMEKLKIREKILFYEDIVLFEDELADNGCSIMNVKIRVMPTSFFVLLRFYLRVDDVLVRINDTRLFHEAGCNYMLREYTRKERPVKDLQVSSHILTDSNEIAQYLQLQEEVFEKLTFPSMSDIQR